MGLACAASATLTVLLSQREARGGNDDEAPAESVEMGKIRSRIQRHRETFLAKDREDSKAHTELVEASGLTISFDYPSFAHRPPS